MIHGRSGDGWAESYNCTRCGLVIKITHGETMHAAPDKEEWIRKPRKPREWMCFLKENGILVPFNNPIATSELLNERTKTIRVREVIE